MTSRRSAPISDEHLHINDPRFGGIGTFGIHIARRNDFHPYGPANFTWDLTELMNADERGGYGVCDRHGDYTLLSDGESYPKPILSVRRLKETLKNGERQRVTVETVWDGTGSPLYFKEPKLVVHGLKGYRFIQCIDKYHRPLGLLHDVTKLAKPSVHTLQFRNPRRAGMILTGKSPQLTLMFDKRGWDAWADDADQDEPLGDGAPYCLQGPPFGQLTRAWESAHFPGVDAAGVMFHAWEGGSGYMDCLCAFRPAIPGDRYSATLTVTRKGTDA